jgi:transcriptional regulator with PAS, ATPase and Fis domain
MGEGQRSTVVGREFGRLVARMTALAARGATVLVHGATGTGKELLLRAFTRAWEKSGRRGKSAIVNCAAFPRELIDSELFGSTKGAFTGAVDRRGLIEGKGCLAFDELGDASPDFQVRLLRLMEHGEYRPVGDPNLRHSDATIIAATNKLDAVRTDLAWRFDVRIRVPSLWERRGDLVDLLYHFGRQLRVAGFTERCLKYLVEYTWPGNAREVRFLLSEAAEVANGQPLDLGNLPLPVPDRSVARTPGRTWRLDDQFVERVGHRFPSRYDEIIQMRDKQAYRSLLPSVAAVPDDYFRQTLLKHVYNLAAAVERLATGQAAPLTESLVNLPTPRDAMQVAEKLWYERQVQKGHSTREIATEAHLTPQQVRNVLVKHGLRARVRRSLGNGSKPSS